MAKDKNLLLGVSVLFTEKTLEEILCKVSGEKQMNVLSWEFGDATAKGDSYLSTINKICVEGEANGKVTRVSLVVKSLPKNVGRRKTFRSDEFFRNEINFYTQVVPKFTEFLEAKDQTNLLVIPRCLAALTDGENDFLALQDVSIFGFVPASRQSTLTFAQCGVILKALARFHAVSFAYKDQNKEEFEHFTKVLSETYYSNQLWYWYDKLQASLFRTAKDALYNEYPNSEAEIRFNKYDRRDIYNKIVGLCNRVNAPTAVITEGDSWAPNFLVRDGDEEDALMLDFQLARCGSPVLDISFFIFACTSRILRDEHYDDLLRIYHAELTESIAKLGSDPEKVYPWKVFEAEVEEQSIFGVVFSMEAIPFSLLESSEAFDLDDIQGDEAVDISDIMVVKNIKSQEGRRRLADVIVHAVEKHYL